MNISSVQAYATILCQEANPEAYADLISPKVSSDRIPAIYLYPITFDPFTVIPVTLWCS
jgi:hypothetical protein